MELELDMDSDSENEGALPCWVMETGSSFQKEILVVVKMI